MSRSILPPRLKDWKKGKIQVGLFVRNDQGTIEATSNAAAPETVKLAAELLARLLAKDQAGG